MNTFETISTVIRNRRSTKPAEMNGKKIDNALIQQLLELADWAPTHARTEPWRFIVHEEAGKKQFCLDHAEVYKANTDPEQFNQGKYEKLQTQGDPISHIIVVYMKRTTDKPIPAIEETAAVSAAMQNMLLGAAALGLSALWSTGGMTHHPAMKDHLGLDTEDVIMGLLFLGYSDIPTKEGKRNIPLTNKVTWRS